MSNLKFTTGSEYKNKSAILLSKKIAKYLDEFIEDHFVSLNYGPVKSSWEYAILELWMLKKGNLKYVGPHRYRFSVAIYIICCIFIFYIFLLEIKIKMCRMYTVFLIYFENVQHYYREFNIVQKLKGTNKVGITS